MHNHRHIFIHVMQLPRLSQRLQTHPVSLSCSWSHPNGRQPHSGASTNIQLPAFRGFEATVVGRFHTRCTHQLPLFPPCPPPLLLLWQGTITCFFNTHHLFQMWVPWSQTVLSTGFHSWVSLPQMFSSLLQFAVTRGSGMSKLQKRAPPL